MKLSTTHQALIELEQDLNNLNSARSQVDKVSTMAEQVVQEIAKLVTVTDSLQQEIKAKEESLGISFQRRLKNFNDQLNIQKVTISSNVEDVNHQFSALLSNSVRKMKDFHLKVEKNWNAHSVSLADHLEGFKNNLQKKSEDVIAKADEQRTVLDLIVIETSKQLKALEESIDAAKERILTFDFESKIEVIEGEAKNITHSLPPVIKASNELKAEINRIGEDLQKLSSEIGVNQKKLENLNASFLKSFENKTNELNLIIEDQRIKACNQMDAWFQKIEKNIGELSKKIDENHKSEVTQFHQLSDLSYNRYDKANKKNIRNMLILGGVLLVVNISIIAVVLFAN